MIGDALNKSARKAYADELAPAGSPWASGAWKHLFTGWELAVFRNRTAAYKQYRKQLKRLEEERREAGDSLHHQSLGVAIGRAKAEWQNREDLRHFPWCAEK